jgi:tetratricopeptide (TPR) repeat protein
LWLGFLLLASASRACAADATAPTFEMANKLYEEGKYSDAAAAYEKVAASGQVSAALYFNLGNAFFKAGQLGRAIAAYGHAEQLAPRDPDVRANLHFVRRQVPNPTLGPTRLETWLANLTLNEWTLLTAAAVWIFFLLLAALQRWPNARATLRNYSVLMAIITVGLGACLVAAYRETRMERTAIVIARDAVVRLGPLAESAEAFTAHDGAELRVVDQKDDWIAVSAGPGRFGWVRRDQVILSHPG